MYVSQNMVANPRLLFLTIVEVYILNVRSYLDEFAIL